MNEEWRKNLDNCSCVTNGSSRDQVPDLNGKLPSPVYMVLLKDGTDVKKSSQIKLNGMLTAMKVILFMLIKITQGPNFGNT